MSDAQSQHETARTEIVAILRERLAEIQLRKPHFSMRAFARQLGVAAPVLTEILNGRRNVTYKTAAHLLERLVIEPSRSKLLLEKFAQRKPRATPRIEAAGEATTPAPEITVLSTDQFNVVADWHYFAILSLAETVGFKSDAGWIARRLGIPKGEALRAVETLVRLGLLERGPRGRLHATGKTFSTTTDIPSAPIRQNHAQALELARTALYEIPMELTEFGASVVAADPKTLPEVRQRLRKMRREIADLLGKGEKREVYRLSVQLIPLSKEGSK